MKVTDLRGVNVCVPLASQGKFEPVTMWYGTRYAALKTIVFLDTDEGITGIGEAWAPADGVLHSLKQWIVGQDPFDTNAIDRRINNFGNVLTVVGHLPFARLNVTGGISMALWDIIGKAANKPIYKLLGGKYRDCVEARYWMCDKAPQLAAEEAVEAVRAGFKSLKIKIGLNPTHDLMCVKAVREAVGDTIDIGFDVNGGYTAGEAIWVIKKMEEYDPSHIEEPVNSANIRALARVRRHVDVPILCCGPGCTTKENIQELVFQDAADAVNLDLCRNGGFMETIRCAAVAEAGGLKASCHSSPGELGIATAAQIHNVISIPNFLEPVDSAYTKMLPPAEDIITKPFKYENGTLQVPDGPGLGVEIDPDAFEKARRCYEVELEKWQHVRGNDPRVASRQFYYYHDFPEKHEWQATEWAFRSGGARSDVRHPET